MKKGKGFWLVLGSPGELYRGPDRAKARAAAEAELRGSGAEVEVLRVSRSASLSGKSLKSALPRNAF